MHAPQLRREDAHAVVPRGVEGRLARRQRPRTRRDDLVAGADLARRDDEPPLVRSALLADLDHGVAQHAQPARAPHEQPAEDEAALEMAKDAIAIPTARR